MYEVEIARGAAVLDHHAPADWPTRVDRDALNTLDVERCVVGQLFGVTGSGPLGGDRTWQDVLVELGAPPPGPRGYSSPGQVTWSIEHGFNVAPDGDGHRDYDRLTAEWREYLRVVVALVSAAREGDDRGIDA